MSADDTKPLSPLNSNIRPIATIQTLKRLKLDSPNGLSNLSTTNVHVQPSKSTSRLFNYINDGKRTELASSVNGSMESVKPTKLSPANVSQMPAIHEHQVVVNQTVSAQSFSTQGASFNKETNTSISMKELNTGSYMKDPSVDMARNVILQMHSELNDMLNGKHISLVVSEYVRSFLDQLEVYPNWKYSISLESVDHPVIYMDSPIKLDDNVTEQKYHNRRIIVWFNSRQVDNTSDRQLFIEVSCNPIYFSMLMFVDLPVAWASHLVKQLMGVLTVLDVNVYRMSINHRMSIKLQYDVFMLMSTVHIGGYAWDPVNNRYAINPCTCENCMYINSMVIARINTVMAMQRRYAADVQSVMNCLCDLQFMAFNIYRYFNSNIPTNTC